MDTVSTLTRALSRRFPNVPIWFGEHTGHWWALADDRLIEAESAGDLGLVLDRLQAPQQTLGRPVHRVNSPRVAGPYTPPTISVPPQLTPVPSPARPHAAAATPHRTRPPVRLSPWRRISGLWAPVPAW